MKKQNTLLNKREVSFYIFVGLCGTAVSLSVIFLLLFLKVNYIVANFLGYFVGFILNYLLHSHLTFQTKKTIENSIKYAVVVTISYITNLMVVIFCARYLPVSLFFGQMAGVFVYVSMGYLLNKYWVFRKRSSFE